MDRKTRSEFLDEGLALRRAQIAQSLKAGLEQIIQKVAEENHVSSEYVRNRAIEVLSNKK